MRTTTISASAEHRFETYRQYSARDTVSGSAGDLVFQRVAQILSNSSGNTSAAAPLIAAWHSAASAVGAGLTSSHWTGRAVDIISLSGRVLDGADGQSIRLISMLDPLMPSGSPIGQSNCRASEGTELALENFTQFSDSCDHLHVDLAFAGDKPLTF